MTNEFRQRVTHGYPPAVLWGPSPREVWWWTIPPAVAIIALVTYALAPDYYISHFLPEHFGYLERSHFLLPAIGVLICLRILRMEQTRRIAYLRGAIIAFAVACFYIAGEEESWGQHFFQWATPETWSSINRQDETNLHNTSYYFKQGPQLVLELAIVLGGIVAPFVVKARGPIGGDLIAILTPPIALLPVSLCAVVFKVIDRLQKNDLVPDLVARPSEVTETFYYMFIFFYLVVLYRRVQRL